MPAVDSRIAAVRVHRSGATVSRIADLPTVHAAIEIRGLPLALADETVRARLEGAGDAIATDVQIGLHAVERPDPEPSPEGARLQAVRRDLLGAERQLEQIHVEMRVLESVRVPELAQPAPGQPPRPSPIAVRVALEAFTDAEIEARWAEAKALGDRIDTLRREEAALADEVRRASTAGRVYAHELRKRAVVTIRGKAQNARLILSYYVPGARWVPQYQCRLSADGQRAEIQLRALVAQQSGEDWSAVRLSLSTADPMAWTELGELTAIRIGKAQPPPPMKRGFRPPPAGADALFADMDRDRRKTAALVPARPAWHDPTPSVAPLAPLHFDAPVAAASAPMDAYAEMDDELEEEEAVAPVMARREMARSRKRSAPASLRAQAGGMAPPAPPEPEPEEPGVPGVPRFGMLHLGPADDPRRRNRLHPVRTADAYRASLADEGYTPAEDVMIAVARATEAASAVARRPLPAGAPDVGDASGSFDYAYDADDRVDLLSDGEFHSIPLGTRAAEARVTYVVAPREDANVFRVARLRNPTSAPLLPGPADVYVGDEYVLTTNLPAVPPLGELKLGLGVEQAIKCARNARFRETRSGTGVVAMSELRHAIDITIANRLGRAIDCEVRERIPHPAPDAEVVVEEGAVTPPWEPYKRQENGPVLEGGRRWRVTVPAGEQAVLAAEYLVKIFANTELAGGNRREA